MNEVRIQSLIERYLSDGLAGEDRQSLERALLASPSARQLYWRLAATHADLREWGLGHFGLPAAVPASAPRRIWNRRGTALGSSAATVAALLLASGSMLFAGVAWAIVPRPRPIIEVRLPVGDAGFESGTAPVTQPPGGCTLREMLPSYGAWAADIVRITGPEHGVTPCEGTKMICFEKPLPAPGATDDLRSTACDLFQFVDLRSMERQIATGEATLELSARFCEASSRGDSPARFHIRLFVYDSSPAAVGNTWPNARLDAVAMNQIRYEPAADGGWHRVGTKAILPPGSRFVLLHLTAGLNDHGTASRSHLGRQYCDDVRLVFTAPALSDASLD